jgi:RHS repeat-associated protein
LFEHIEYFPFGESWVEENTNQQRTPYLFSAKELDEETGLYYFGARYYDPRTSVWQSTDPMLEKYLPTANKEKDHRLPGMGGIFNLLNLALYGYAGQNPLKYGDLDGKELVRVEFAGPSAFIGKSLVVDKTFLPVIVAMNDFALSRGIKIDVTSVARPFGQPVSNAKVPPAADSLHLIGRAIDVNFVDKDGRRYSFSDMAQGKMSQNVRGFVDDLKAMTFSTQIDTNRSPRWGGDFRNVDPVHFDAPTSPQNWNQLFKEDQAQLKSGKIDKLIIQDPGANP